jgi:hypothetical protein
MKSPAYGHHPDLPDHPGLKHFAALAALMALQIFLQVQWMKRDARPPAWDESHHLLIALEYRDAVAAGDWTRPLRPVYSNYPPLYHLTLAPFIGSAPDAASAAERAAAVNLAYLSLLVAAVFLLGSRLHSPEAGLAAAVIASFFPAVQWLLRRPMIDLPLAAWVAAAYLLLYWAEDFHQPFWSLALGAVCGLGMITKWSFSVYVGAPLVWSVLTGLRARRGGSVLLFLAAFAAVAGPWYLMNVVPSFLRVSKLASLKEAPDPNVWTWAGWTWYMRGMAGKQLLWPFAAACAAGAGVAVLQRRWRLLAWFLLPVLAFSAVRNKDLRYVMPVLPAAALLCSLAASWAWRPLRKAWWLLLAGWAILLGAGYGAADRWPPAARALAERAGLKTSEGLQADFASPDAWQVEEIVREIRGRAGGGKARVSLASNHPSLHAWVLRLSARLQGWDGLIVSSPKRRLGEFADFILQKTGALGPDYTLGYVKEAAALLERPPDWLETSFAPRAKWPLPDGSSAVLWAQAPAETSLPGGLGELELRLERFPLPRFEAKGLRLKAVPADDLSEARKGLFKKIVIECEELDYRGLSLKEVRLEGRNARINLPLLRREGDVRFLELEELRPSLRLTEESLEDYLRLKARWLEHPDVTLEGGIRVDGRVKGLRLLLRASAELSPDGKRITLRADSAKLGAVSLPVSLAGPFAKKTFSLEPSKDLPFRVKLESLTLKDGAAEAVGVHKSR